MNGLEAQPSVFRRRRRQSAKPARIKRLLLSSCALGFASLPSPVAAGITISRRRAVDSSRVIACSSGNFCYEATTCCGNSCCYSHQTCTPSSSPDSPPTCISEISADDAALLFDTSAPPLVYNATSSSNPNLSSGTYSTTSSLDPEYSDPPSFVSSPGFESYSLAAKISIILGPILGFALLILLSWLIYRWYRRRHPHKQPANVRRSPRVATMIFLDGPPKGHVPISSVASPVSAVFLNSRDGRDGRDMMASRGSEATGWTGYTTYTTSKMNNTVIGVVPSSSSPDRWNSSSHSHMDTFDPTPNSPDRFRLGSTVSITANGNRPGSIKSSKTSSSNTNTPNKLRKSNSISRSTRSSTTGQIPPPPPSSTLPRPPQSSLQRTLSNPHSLRSNSLSSRATSGAYYSAPSTPGLSTSPITPTISKQFQVQDNGMMVYTPPSSTLRREEQRLRAGSSSIQSSIFGSPPPIPIPPPPPILPRPTTATKKAGPDMNDHSRVADMTRMLKELNDSSTALAVPEKKAETNWEVREREDGVAEVRVREMRARKAVGEMGRGVVEMEELGVGGGRGSGSGSPSGG